MKPVLVFDYKLMHVGAVKNLTLSIKIYKRKKKHRKIVSLISHSLAASLCPPVKNKLDTVLLQRCSAQILSFCLEAMQREWDPCKMIRERGASREE